MSIRRFGGNDEHPWQRGGVTPAVLYRAVLLAFGLLVLVLVFAQVVEVVLLVLLVAVVAVPLSAGTSWLERAGIPRWLGAPLVLLSALGVLGLVIALLVPTFVAEGNRLVASLPATVDHLRRDIGHATSSSPTQVGRRVQDFINGYSAHPQRLLGPVTTVGGSIVVAVTALIIVLLTAMYAAINPEALVSGAQRLVPPPRRPVAQLICTRLAIAYVGWLRGLLVGMAVLGVITYVGLRLVGLDYALVFATVTAAAMVVPYFGALFSAIPPVLLALTDTPTKALLVVAVYLIAHQVEGNVIEPLVMARAVKLHPAMVAVGVLAVERLFGFFGLLLAVPILVTVKILVEEVWVNQMERAYDHRPGPRGDSTRGGLGAGSPTRRSG